MPPSFVVLASRGPEGSRSKIYPSFSVKLEPHIFAVESWIEKLRCPLKRWNFKRKVVFQALVFSGYM